MIQSKRALSHVLDWIFPPQCLICRTGIERHGNLCAGCWKNITFLGTPCCDQCGVPFEYAPSGEEGDGILCGACIAIRPPYQKARAVMEYDYFSRPLVTWFKYHDQTILAPTLAAWMVRSGKAALKDVDVIIPVPLHWVRLFLRRYNQSALLSKYISELSGIPYVSDVLMRRRYTAPQAGLTRKQRLLNVRNVFTVPKDKRPSLKGKRVLLVDDVLTTGATVYAATKALRAGGAASVNVLTLARTV